MASQKSSSSSGSHGHGSSSYGSCVTPAGAPPAAGYAAHLVAPQPSLNPELVAKPEPEELADAETEEPAVRVGDKRKGSRLLGVIGAREAAQIRRAAAQTRALQQPPRKKKPYRARRMRAKSPGPPSSDEETVGLDASVASTPAGEGQVGNNDLPGSSSLRINPSSGSQFRGRSALAQQAKQRRRRGG